MVAYGCIRFCGVCTCLWVWYGLLQSKCTMCVLANPACQQLLLHAHTDVVKAWRVMVLKNKQILLKLVTTAHPAGLYMYVEAWMAVKIGQKNKRIRARLAIVHPPDCTRWLRPAEY